MTLFTIFGSRTGVKPEKKENQQFLGGHSATEPLSCQESLAETDKGVTHSLATWAGETGGYSHNSWLEVFPVGSLLPPTVQTCRHADATD